MELNADKSPSAEAQVTPTGPSKNPKAKKLSIIFILLVTVPWLLIFLTIFISTGNGIFTLGSPRFITLMIFSVLNLGGILWVIQILNRKVEMSPQGLTQTTPYGKTVFIAWDEIGPVMTDVGGIVRVKDKAGQKTIKLTKAYENFEYMKLKVSEASEKNRSFLEKEDNFYSMTSDVAPTLLVCGIFFLIFSGFIFFELARVFLGMDPKIGNPLFAEWLFSIGGIATATFGILCLWQGPRVKAAKIEITSSGIARLEKDGSSVFIKWEDVARLTKRERAKQIGVYSLYPPKKIMVDYQFEGFEQIRDRIFKEYAKRLTLPMAATTYGPKVVLPNLVLQGIVVGMIGLMFWIEYTQQTTGGPVAFAVVIIMLVSCGLGFLYSESKLVKALILNGNEITLRFVFSNVVLKAWEVSEVLMQCAAGRNGTYYLIQLIAEDRKKYTFANGLSTQVGVYLVLNKWLEERKYEPH